VDLLDALAVGRLDAFGIGVGADAEDLAGFASGDRGTPRSGLPPAGRPSGPFPSGPGATIHPLSARVPPAVGRGPLLNAPVDAGGEPPGAVHPQEVRHDAEQRRRREDRGIGDGAGDG